MRKWCAPFLSAAFVLGLAVPSFSEPTDFDATFIVELGSFPGFTSTASGSLDATLGGGGVTNFTLPASTFKIAKFTPVVPGIPVQKGLTLTGVSFKATNLKGTFDVTGGKGSIKGDSTLFFNKKSISANIPLDDAIGTTNTVNTKLLGIVPLKIQAKKWTVGKAVLQSVPLGGGAAVNVTKTGKIETAGGIQRFTFIAPTQITISASAPPSLIPSFGTLIVEFSVPEAANALLLATGAAVLLLVGYRRSVA
jgi:hypothetical protein